MGIEPTTLELHAAAPPTEPHHHKPLYVSMYSITVLFDSSDEDFAHNDAWCRFSSSDLHDMEYILEHHFNKIMVAQYNSTTERWTGYTAWGVISAEKWNEDPDEIPRRRSDMDVLCKPYVSCNNLVKLEGPSSDSSLVCSVHFFYPKHIRVTWLRNGEEVTSDVTSTDVLFVSYSPMSLLNREIKILFSFACGLETIIFVKRVIADPSLPKSEKNKIVIGVCGLLLGVVFVVAGLIYWKKSTGRLLDLIGELDYGTCD
uniref:Ig-like domain-containing protein n=1 Tax=Oncorhynchus kisutch TaxID=8019 RepID=A0A8C7FA80_ONCKI